MNKEWALCPCTEGYRSVSTQKLIISGFPPGFILKPALFSIFLITSSWYQQYQADHCSFYTSRKERHPERMTSTGLKISKLKQGEVQAYHQYSGMNWLRGVLWKRTCINCWTKCWTWASSMHLHTRTLTVFWSHEVTGDNSPSLICCCETLSGIVYPALWTPAPERHGHIHTGP